MPRRFSQRTIRRRKRLLWGAFFLLVVGGLGWLVFLTPLFTIRALVIEGASKSAEERISDEIYSLMGQRRHLLFVRPRVWRAALTSALPELKSVEVTRTFIRFPPTRQDDFFANVLRVRVQEREPIGIACRNAGSDPACFFFDREGILFHETTASSTAPVVFDQRDNVAYRLRERVFDAALVKWLEGLLREFASGAVRAERFELSENETNVLTAEHWTLRLAHARALEEQLEAARLVLEKEIGPRRSELEYIDTTIKNRVYYRFQQ